MKWRLEVRLRLKKISMADPCWLDMPSTAVCICQSQIPGELYPIFSNNLSETRIWKRMDVCTYNLTLLYSRNYHDIVNQLHVSKTFKNERKKRNANLSYNEGVPLWYSRLRIQHRHSSGSGFCRGAGLIPGPGTSTCQGDTPTPKKTPRWDITNTSLRMTKIKVITTPVLKTKTYYPMQHICCL